MEDSDYVVELAGIQVSGVLTSVGNAVAPGPQPFTAMRAIEFVYFGDPMADHRYRDLNHFMAWR